MTEAANRVGGKAAELLTRLREIDDQLGGLPAAASARFPLAAERLDVVAALRAATKDDVQLAAWAERSRPNADAGAPFGRSDGEGGGAAG